MADNKYQEPNYVASVQTKEQVCGRGEAGEQVEKKVKTLELSRGAPVVPS